MVRAAVLAQAGEPLEIRDDVEVAEPRSGEVRVRMVASGVCHSDLSAREGTLLLPTPIVLGHEGAGIVEETGDGVTALRPGDKVVLSWVPHCGRCWFCERNEGHLCEPATTALAAAGMLDGTTRLTSRGRPLHQIAGTGTFSEVAVVSEASAVKVDDDVDLGLAALLGCAVLTGVGAARRTGRVTPGETVAVLGCGGVGLSVVQGARLAGAGAIVAVDTVPEKLQRALELGATDAVDASAGDPVGAVMARTGQRGADAVFEVVGLERTIQQAIAMTRRGGRTVLVGLPAIDTVVQVPAFLGLVLSAKSLIGCWYGSSDVHEDVPAMLDLHRRGELQLAPLVSRTATLDEVDEALDALAAGEGLRTVIRYD